MIESVRCLKTAPGTATLSRFRERGETVDSLDIEV
jgi:hypothetical protein